RWGTPRSRKPRAPMGTSSASGTSSESTSDGSCGRGVRQKSLHIARAVTPLLHRVIALKPPRGHDRAIRLARAIGAPHFGHSFGLGLCAKLNSTWPHFGLVHVLCMLRLPHVTDVQSR